MDQFDIIVIGGGSAGSAAAGRLAEDGSRTVCLVEAGGTNDIVRVKTPGGVREVEIVDIAVEEQADA